MQFLGDCWLVSDAGTQMCEAHRYSDHVVYDALYTNALRRYIAYIFHSYLALDVDSPSSKTLLTTLS